LRKKACFRKRRRRSLAYPLQTVMQRSNCDTMLHELGAESVTPLK